MTAEFGNFPGSFATNINGDPDHRNQRAAEDDCDQPGGNVTYAQCAIESPNGIDWLARVQINFHDPCDHNEDEDENVVALQSTSDRFEFADFERRQDQIFADEFLPFALQ